MNIEQTRAAFEALFPMPENCTWCGNGYAATEFNAWDAINYAERFKGFQAAIEFMQRGGAQTEPTMPQLESFIKRAGFTYGWSNLESWARRMAEQAVLELNQAARLKEES